MGNGHCSLWCLDVLNEDQTKAPLASNGFGGQAKWWPCCTKPRPLKPGPKQTSSYTNGASCKVCINQGNVLFHMILVSRRSRRFLSFQFKSNLISMFKQRKTSPKISEASCKVSKHPQSSNADSHHVVTFLCFAWTWYSGHILSRIYSGSQTGLFLHLLRNALSLPFKIHRYGMETRADIRQSHALDAFGCFWSRVWSLKIVLHENKHVWRCKCIHIQSIYAFIFEINDND